MTNVLDWLDGFHDLKGHYHQSGQARLATIRTTTRNQANRHRLFGTGMLPPKRIYASHAWVEQLLAADAQPGAQGLNCAAGCCAIPERGERPVSGASIAGASRSQVAKCD